MAILPPSPPQVVFLFLVAVPHQKLPERLRPPLKESKKERHRRQFEEKVRLEDAARELKKRFMKWKKNQEEGTNEQARLNGNLCRGRLGRGSNKLGRGSKDRLHTKSKSSTDRTTDTPTDTVTYRSRCRRQKFSRINLNSLVHYA